MKNSRKKNIQLSLYDEFDVRVYSFQQHTVPSLPKHFSFELVYVLQGNGFHTLDHEKSEYAEDNFFVLTPHQTYQFEAREETKLCVISFNEVFFSPGQPIDYSPVLKKLEIIWYNLDVRPERITFGKEKQLMRYLVYQLIGEKEKKQLFYYAHIQHIIFLLLSLIARDLQAKNINSKTSDSAGRLALDVMNYIQYHIYEKKKLSLPHLAKAFGKSTDSLLYNFKNATAKTVKEFITEYKLSLVKSRLLFSEMPVSEIAEELDFTDESHLNKIFKGRMNLAPGKFRGAAQEIITA